jgi:hypothetical protein
VPNIIKKLSGFPDGSDTNSFATGNDGPFGLTGFKVPHIVLFAPDSASAGALATPAVLGTTGTTTTASVTSPFVINITWDASVQSAPIGFMSGILAAAQYLESQFSDAVTLNIDIGYGEVNGTALGTNALGSSESFLTSVSYPTLVNALKVDAKTAADTTAVASLPAASPVNGTYWATTGEAKAVGLLPGSSTAIDGFTGFSSSLAFDFNNADGVTAGSYDFNGVVLHELSEVMGRMLLTGTTIGTTANSYDAYDLFHYASSGVRDFSASTPGYFSNNTGVTNLGGFNTVPGGDAGDWGAAMGNDSFNAFSASGAVNAVSSADLTAMDVIGWDRTASSSSQPTGVAISATTQSLANAQSSAGLAANVSLATVTQIGGAGADSYSFTLGGTGAAAFGLSTTSNTGTLSTAATGVAGSLNGRVYGLTLSTTDLNSGLSSAPSALDVVVGSSAADTVSVAALVGSASTGTPTFIFGLAGADQVNATGMTSKLWIVGGAGADSLTGGSGVNDYLYGAIGDSTGVAMDIVANFHAAADLIDLTGLGTALTFAGKITATSLAADSVGWQVTSGNTFAYVNTSAGTESLTGTNMKIELRGSVALTSSNFLHA